MLVGKVLASVGVDGLALLKLGLTSTSANAGGVRAGE